MTGPVVPSDEELREALAEALARALGEHNVDPTWTGVEIVSGLGEAPIAAAQARWEDQEAERSAQVEAMRCALEDDRVRAVVLADRERYANQRAAEELRAAAASAHPWEAIGVSDLRARAAALTAREEATT